MAMVSWLIKAGFCCLIVRFFFPRVFLVPAVVIAGVLYVAGCLARFRVQLDRAVGEVAITVGLWTTRRVPLTEIERVEEVLGFGAEIKVVGGYTLGFSPVRKRRWVTRLLKIRTGFEGMERAITQAVAAARAADLERAAAAKAAARGSQHTIPWACVAFGCGLLSLAVAVAVQPQAGGWLVESVSVLLRVYYSACGIAVLMVGTWMLHGALRHRRTARQHT